MDNIKHNTINISLSKVNTDNIKIIIITLQLMYNGKNANDNYLQSIIICFWCQFK